MILTMKDSNGKESEAKFTITILDTTVDNIAELATISFEGIEDIVLNLADLNAE